MSKLKAAVLGVAVVVSAVLTACSAEPAQQPYTPTSYPVVAGVTYCPYFYSPAEPIECHGTPYLFPAYQPSAGDLIAAAMWAHLLTYGPSYYHTDAYYTRNIYGHAHITTINVTTFKSTGRDFDGRYASQERSYTPKFRDSKGQVVTGSKYGQMNDSIVKKLPATGGGGQPAGVKDPGKAPAAPPKPPVTVPKPATVGKR